MKLENKKCCKIFYSSGFTLIEVMASVAILSIGLIGSLTAINYNLRNISGQEDRIIASKLAEEGIELARNIRDTNWRKSAADWKDGFGFVSPNNPITTRLKFFCGGITHETEEKNGGGTWNSTLGSGSGCSGNTKCRVYMYKIDGEPDENALCYSDNFDTNFTYPPVVGGINYRSTNPRTEFYRLVTATKSADGNSVTINSSVKYGNGSVFIIEETLYNWKP